jgi:hypothetical protein
MALRPANINYDRPQTNSFGSKVTRGAVSAALLGAVFVALPIKSDAQHPIGYGPAFASGRHDSADPYSNNTDGYGVTLGGQWAT